MDGKPEPLPRAVEFYTRYASLAERREAELGHPVENCPTAADLWSLAESTRAMLAGGSDRTAAEIWTYMQELARVSDKWVDPENDPIGADLYGVIEETIYNLRRNLEKAVPATAKDNQTWADLRALKHAMARQVHRESLKPPLLKRLRQKLFGH
jgi:hypothetical protein